jgi:6-phosphogluconolactonase (cycloisomerase 2 family)
MQRSVARRTFLKTASALAGAAVTTANRLDAQGAGTVICYVGAYTDRGKGIHMYTQNGSDGTLTPYKILTGIVSPSSLAFHPNKKFMYAVNEISNFTGANTSGSVTSMSIDPATGDLKILNAINSGGRGPAHLSVDPSGKYVFAANYGSGQVGVLSIKSDGSLDAVVDSKQITGELGKNPAAEAPPGSFAISGHDAPHVHQTEMDPFGRFLLASDLGTDSVYVYKLDASTGLLSPVGSVKTTNGAGPRHFHFHPNGRYVYVVTEEASTVLLMSWDPGSGGLEILQSLSTLPKGYEGTNYPSEIQTSPDGRFMYLANRLHDSISIYSLDPGNGGMKLQDIVWTRGSYPRNFEFDPNGNFLYVAHSRSDNVTSFAVNRTTGGLTFTGQFVGIGNPSKILFLRL